MRYIKFPVMAFLVGLLVTGCKKDFGDLNVDPNKTTTPPTSALLTNAMAGVAGAAQNTEIGNFVQYYTQLQYPDVSLYQTTNLSWNGFYYGALKDLQKVIELASDPNAGAAVTLSGNTVNQIQIARILKVYYFSIMTDRYGDIPYFDALKGEGQVKYDKQEVIYNDFFKELTEADSSFQFSGIDIKGDIIYNGDLTKWQKLANSMRMMFAMRLSKVNPAKGAAEFNAALNAASGFMTSNADNFGLTFTSAFVNSYSQLTSASDFAISKTIADTLNKYSDPRTKIYGQANSTGNVVGVPYGLNRGHVLEYTNANPNYSKAFTPAYRDQTAPVVVIPVAYIDLLRAEAKLVYNTGDESAISLFRKGILHSWQQWGAANKIATSADSSRVDAYVASLGITNTVSVKDIQLQYWLALYGSSQNAWNEWRRTGVPNLTPAPDAVNAREGRVIPRRFGYPATEQNQNKANYQAAVGAMPYGGEDLHNNRVWWDKP